MAVVVVYLVRSGSDWSVEVLVGLVGLYNLAELLALVRSTASWVIAR